jgi:replicative DNA helicase
VLEYSPDTRVVIANAETSPDGLFARQLSAVTRIDSARIRFADLNSDELEQVTAAIGEMSQRMQQVEFMLDPCLPGIVELMGSEPGLLVVDYIQKFAPGDKDARLGVNLVMGWLRKLCLRGWSVLAISATKRDSKGKHSADELGISSFRESGDIEYNLDAAYVLRDNGPIDEKVWLRHVTLKCEKNRNGPKQDFELRFHMPQMRFDAHELEPVGFTEFNAWSGSAFGGDDE